MQLVTVIVKKRTSLIFGRKRVRFFVHFCVKCCPGVISIGYTFDNL